MSNQTIYTCWPAYYNESAVLVGECITRKPGLCGHKHVLIPEDAAEELKQLCKKYDMYVAVKRCGSVKEPDA